MEFFDTVKKRRSIRRFTETQVPGEAIEKALAAAIIAPTSSNAQTWDFYWTTNKTTQKKLVHCCLNQSAARTASDLLVVVASPTAWKRSQPELVKYVEEIKAPKGVIDYYKKLLPLMYKWGFLNSIGYFKLLVVTVLGLFRPMPRGPNTLRDIQEVCIKSAALAAENFVLAMTAQGYATCMMEGFDESRVKRLLKLKYSDRVVMVIGIGEEAEMGTWGPQFRLDSKSFIHRL